MSLHIEVVGTGPDLALLHGWGMHGGVWEPIVAELAAEFRLHIVDLPGLGNSQAIAPYTLGTLAHAIAQALPENISVCGWSLGGQLSMQWALERPEQIDKLILVGTTPRFVSDTDWDHGIDPQVFRQFADQVQQDYRGTLSRFLALQAHGGDAAKDTIRTLRERFFERGEPRSETLQAGLDILLGTDLREQAARLQTSSLVLHGSYDKLAPVAAGHWLGHHLPNVHLEVCDGASHAPFLSHPSWFVAAVKEFLHE